MISPELERLALILWRRRQIDFPRFVRRDKPDVLDLATGAWMRCVAEVLAEHPSYRVADGAITCLICGATSPNPNDVRLRYCGSCNVFHDDVRELATALSGKPASP